MGLKLLFHSFGQVTSGQRRASWAPMQQNIITLQKNKTLHFQLYTLHCDYVVHGSFIVSFILFVCIVLLLSGPFVL